MSVWIDFDCGNISNVTVEKRLPYDQRKGRDEGSMSNHDIMKRVMKLIDNPGLKNDFHTKKVELSEKRIF